MVSFYFDFLRPSQFAIELRLGHSKKREEELKRIREYGQTRRIVVSPYGEILFADIPLFKALVAAGYTSIAVVVVVGCAKPSDIKAAKAFSAKYPLRRYGRRQAQQAHRLQKLGER